MPSEGQTASTTTRSNWGLDRCERQHGCAEEPELPSAVNLDTSHLFGAFVQEDIESVLMAVHATSCDIEPGTSDSGSVSIASQTAQENACMAGGRLCSWDAADRYREYPGHKGPVWFDKHRSCSSTFREPP